MKTKIKYPDWNNPTDMLISRDSTGKSHVWSEYSREDDDMLSLCVTLESAGGLIWHNSYDSKETAEQARIDENRRVTWQNAIQIAELLWRSVTYRQYVVRFRPKGDEREAILIYRLLPGLNALRISIGDEH